mmetsp:Transcript_106972/g.345179  ORF Transcript_106972/g.345179 Transcript_106972/m.345179 type:complete len:214 (+) Transcript_106972:16-657(+)
MRPAPCRQQPAHRAEPGRPPARRLAGRHAGHGGELVGLLEGRAPGELLPERPLVVQGDLVGLLARDQREGRVAAGGVEDVGLPGVRDLLQRLELPGLQAGRRPVLGPEALRGVPREGLRDGVGHLHEEADVQAPLRGEAEELHRRKGPQRGLLALRADLGANRARGLAAVELLALAGDHALRRGRRPVLVVHADGVGEAQDQALAELLPNPVA